MKTTTIAAAIATAAVLLTAAIVVSERANRAPDLSMETTTGQTIDLAALRGRPVLMTFWATTCPSCIKELPGLAALYHRLHVRGLALIGVSMYYDMPLRVVEAIKQERIPYPVVMDLDRKIARAFNTGTVTPTAVLIAPDGRIVFHRVGSLDLVTLERQIERMLPPASSARARRGAPLPRS